MVRLARRGLVGRMVLRDLVVLLVHRDLAALAALVVLRTTRVPQLRVAHTRVSSGITDTLQHGIVVRGLLRECD